MSYLGPDRTTSASRPGKTSGSSTSIAARHEPIHEHETDWHQVAIFGAGVALGILVGAGVALLTAPQAGQDTRADLRRGASRTTRALGRRSRNAWLDLRDELRDASTSLRRRKTNRAEERALRRELARESRG